MDCGDGDDAGHGDDETAVFLDAADIAFAACEGAFGNADFLAGVVLRGVGAEDGVGVGAGACDEDEGAHLTVGNGGWNVDFCRGVVQMAGARLFAGVDGELELFTGCFAAEGDQLLFGAAHEEQGGDQRLALGVEGAVALEATTGHSALEGEDLVVEHFECVPVETVVHLIFLSSKMRVQICTLYFYIKTNIIKFIEFFAVF